MSTPKQQRAAFVGRLTSLYSDFRNKTTPIISQDQFVKLSKSHQVFTLKGLKEFADKALATNNEQVIEKAFNEVKDLLKIDVATSNKVLSFFLKKSKESQDIEKAAGDRGGKVIGYTKSGKPVYQTQSAKHEKGYTSKDHEDAAYAHIDHNKKTGGSNNDYHVNQFDRHMASSKHKKQQEEVEKDTKKSLKKGEIAEDLLDIVKGKKAEIGETRMWSGKEYTKTQSGWVPKGKGGEKGKKEEGGEKTPAAKIDDHAKNASDQALEAAKEKAKDPSVKEAAERELKRRESENKPDLPALKELDRLGLKYELDPNNKTSPIKKVFVPMNESDKFYKDVEDVLDRHNLEHKKILTQANNPRSKGKSEGSELKREGGMKGPSKKLRPITDAERQQDERRGKSYDSTRDPKAATYEWKDAAAMHDHSDKKFEDTPDDYSHKVGDPVKVQRSITDPLGKHGETGTVVSISDEGDVRVRFSDGNLGVYQPNTLMREKKDSKKEEKSEKGGDKKETSEEEKMFAKIFKAKATGKVSPEYYKVLHKMLRDGKVAEVENRINRIK